MILGGFNKFHHAPWGLIGKTNRTDFSGSDQFLQGGQGFMNRSGFRVFLVKVAELSKIVCWPVWPV